MPTSSLPSLTKSSHSLSPSPLTHFFYFTNSYYTSTLCIFPIPVSRIQIYTKIYTGNGENEDFHHENDPNGSFSVKTPNYTLIYDDVPSCSIIYLRKAHHIETLYVKGELAAPTLGSVTSSSEHTQVFLGPRCELSKLRDSFIAGGHRGSGTKRTQLQQQGKESAYTTQNQNRMQNIINSMLNVESSSSGSNSPTDSTTQPSARTYSSALNSINSINFQIKHINLSDLCRNWLWRRIRSELLYGTRDELREAHKRLRSVVHQQLDLWLQDSDDSAEDEYDNDLNSTLLALQRERRAAWQPDSSLISNVEHSLPVARAAHQMISHKDSLYLFGGFTGKWELADCWRYEIPKKQWHCISMNTSEQGGITERSCHQCTVHANKVYFLGRYLDPRSRCTHSVRSDFFSFDLNAHQWEVLSTDTQRDGGPPLIYEHQMCTVNDYIYVFGGRIIHPIVDPSTASPRETSQMDLPTVTNNEEIFSGLYSYHIYSKRWTHIQRTHNLSRHVILPTTCSSSRSASAQSGITVDPARIQRTTLPLERTTSRNSEEHFSESAVVLNHIPLHAHIGHSMVYNPKTHQLLIISSGSPRQQNTTSLLHASKRQILAYDLNTDLVFDLTATSKLSHCVSGGAGDVSPFSDAAAFRELNRFEKDLNGSFFGWPPFHHEMYNAKSTMRDECEDDGIFGAHSSEWLPLREGITSPDALENFRVDSTQHLSILDEEHQELHIYETIIADASSATTTSGGYAHSTLWTYCLETDTWILVERFHPQFALSSQQSTTATPLPPPRFSAQFVYNEQSQRFFLYGGNPGKASHPRTKLGDLYALELQLPSEQSIQAIVLFYLYRQLFLEMDPGMFGTVEFLRDQISPLVKNMHDEMYGKILANHMHQMTTHLIRDEVNEHEVRAMRRNLISLLRELIWVGVNDE